MRYCGMQNVDVGVLRARGRKEGREGLRCSYFCMVKERHLTSSSN